jgi:hypothetical protein
MLSLSELKKAGFVKSGAYRRLDGIVNLCGNIPKHPGIYLLLVGGRVRYVGKTERSLYGRLHAYEKVLRKGFSRRMVHKGILQTIADTQSVGIYTLTVTVQQQFFKRNGLPVDYLVGVEAGLIEHLDDENWNPFNSAVRAKRAKLRRDP